MPARAKARRKLWICTGGGVATRGVSQTQCGTEQRRGAVTPGSGRQRGRRAHVTHLLRHKVEVVHIERRPESLGELDQDNIRHVRRTRNAHGLAHSCRAIPLREHRSTPNLVRRRRGRAAWRRSRHSARVDSRQSASTALSSLPSGVRRSSSLHSLSGPSNITCYEYFHGASSGARGARGSSTCAADLPEEWEQRRVHLPRCVRTPPRSRAVLK